jgi:hypothetical protein
MLRTAWMIRGPPGNPRILQILIQTWSLLNARYRQQALEAGTSILTKDQAITQSGLAPVV